MNMQICTKGGGFIVEEIINYKSKVIYKKKIF
jgi:hypothetical protein